MILYEVSGSQFSPSFFRKLSDARTFFEKAKVGFDEFGRADAELRKVRVEVSAARQLELLNGDWGSAREEIAVIESYEYVPNDERK